MNKKNPPSTILSNNSSTDKGKKSNSAHPRQLNAISSY